MQLNCIHPGGKRQFAGFRDHHGGHIGIAKRSEVRGVSSFRNLGGQVQRVPTSRAFWDLEKNVINLKRLLCTLLIVYYLLLGYFIRKYVVKTQDL